INRKEPVFRLDSDYVKNKTRNRHAGCSVMRAQFIVVNTSVLPEIFEKVLEVKKLVADHSEKSFASACKRVGISRSAFYKYRDYVFHYEDKMTQRIVNLNAVLRDEAGVLSSVLIALHNLHANILTVNQSIPVDGVASVSLSLQCGDDTVNLTHITKTLSALYGVVEVKLISGQ
ncbi:MAG: ACT domain-containing protein, partial [Ruminococcus sp.]